MCWVSQCRETVFKTHRRHGCRFVFWWDVKNASVTQMTRSMMRKMGEICMQVTMWKRVCERVPWVHAYLESVLRLCLLLLEGFRGNELGMMGVGVQGRLLQARRMQGCERWGVRERQKETKGGQDKTHGEEGEKDSQLTLEEEWLIMHMQRRATPHTNQ